MQVARWRDGLAVLLPNDVVQTLSLKEGDEISVEVAGEHAILVRRGVSGPEAQEALRSLNLQLPAGYTFSRDELYDE